jgi:peptidoglycan hydrolase CwlO-like protein
MNGNSKIKIIRFFISITEMENKIAMLSQEIQRLSSTMESKNQEISIFNRNVQRINKQIRILD